MASEFPKEFVWGTATASYQIEGGAFEDGKGMSIWDVFCMREGNIDDGSSGEVACNHYHRWKEDVALMKEFSIQAYRFSISWPRVIPEGTGKVNRKGLEFYDKLVDELLAAGIEPYVTLYHWDLPYELHKQGGWLNTKSPEWFAEYAEVITDALSDRVGNWMTFNEPNGFIWAGYQAGVHAPGFKMGDKEVLQAIFNVQLAHGKACQVIRSKAKKQPKLAFVYSGSPLGIPETDDDIDAAHEFTFATAGKEARENAGWWLDPVYLGGYPEDGLEMHKENLPEFTDEDMKTINEPLDLCCYNVYKGFRVRKGKDGKPEKVKEEPWDQKVWDGWPLSPDVMYWASKFFYERYSLPIMVTENGLSNNDWIASDGKVHDQQRIDYLSRYISELKRALDDGIDVQGYFVWSFMDNFEWASGYGSRYGMIHVDYKTGERTPKDSLYWYKRLIDSDGDTIDKIM